MTLQFVTSFNRRARLSRIEAGHLMRLALPILGAELAQIGMSTVDVIMAGHASTTTLAAVSIGSSVWVPIMLFMIGTTMGLTAIVAQHAGGHAISRIRPAVQQALWLALALGLLSAILILWAGPAVLSAMHVPTDMGNQAVAYLSAVAFGLPGMAIYEALRSYSDGLGHTRASLLFALLGLAVNTVGDALLIFGGSGLEATFGIALPGPLAALPALGAAGCGMATAISMWVMAAALFVYTRITRVYKPSLIGPAWAWPSRRLLDEQLRLGLPVGVAIFSEVTLFTVIALFLARYGKVVVSAHTVALDFTSVVFVLPLSLGMALTVRIGQARGRRKYRHARFVAWNGVACALVTAIIIDLILIFGGPYVVRFYTDAPAVRALAVTLLQLAAIYQFSDASQISMSGALRGYKDTRIIMWITMFSYWIVGMGSGRLLGEGIPSLLQGLGVYGYWIGLIAGLSTAAVLLCWRLNYITTLSIRHLRAPDKRRATMKPDSLIN